MDEKEKINQETEETANVEDEAIKNIANFTSEKLADMIVMNRYLSLYGELSTAAMQELASRREGGDTFDYETYITTNLEKLPKFQIDLGRVNSLVEKLKKII
jgi:hypothetical protein